MYNQLENFSPRLIDDAFSSLLLEAEETAFSLLFKKLERGTIARKKIKGKVYVYIQTYKNGKYYYTYLGPGKDPRVTNIVKNFQEKKALVQHLKEREKLFVKTLKELGIIPVQGMMAKILKVLSEEGVISGQFGILIGTLAFYAYQIKLGFTLSQKTPIMRTADVDIARGEPVILFIKETTMLSKILEKLGDKFIPEGRISEGFPLRLVHINSGIKIEVLAPKKGSAEVFFLTKNSVPAVILGERRLIPVHVPSPEYFALHKLIVVGRRSQEPLKIQKDLLQVYTLFKVLHLRKEVFLLEEAFEELKKYLKFKKTKNYFEKGLKFLTQLSDIPEEILNIIS